MQETCQKHKRTNKNFVTTMILFCKSICNNMLNLLCDEENYFSARYFILRQLPYFERYAKD